MTSGGLVRPDRADLGDGDLEVGEHFQQERLELVVGPVHLVDQQHRLVAGPDRLQQRPLQQEPRAEQLVDRVVVGDLPLGQGPDVQHLAGVVPLVQRLVGVDALVALQPDQLAAEDGGEHLGDLGLAHPDLALEQDRPLQAERDEQRGGQAAVGQVPALAQDLGELADGLRTLHAALSSPSVCVIREAGAYRRASAGPRTRSRTLPARGSACPRGAAAPATRCAGRARRRRRAAQPQAVEADVRHPLAGLGRAAGLVEVRAGLALGAPHLAEHLEGLIRLTAHRRYLSARCCCPGPDSNSCWQFGRPRIKGSLMTAGGWSRPQQAPGRARAGARVPGAPDRRWVS